MLSYCITKSSSHLSLQGLKVSDCALGFTGVWQNQHYLCRE